MNNLQRIWNNVLAPPLNLFLNIFVNPFLAYETRIVLVSGRAIFFRSHTVTVNKSRDGKLTNLTAEGGVRGFPLYINHDQIAAITTRLVLK